MTSPTRFHPKQLPSTDRRRRLGAPRPSCAHLWSRRARSRHLPCVAKRHGPSSAVACLAEAVAFVGLVLPFSGLPAAFWGSRHLRSVLGVRGSLVSLVGELVRKAQLGHQPNLGFCLLVSQQTLALYFFFAFFCASSFFLLAPRNRCRSRWHSIGLPSCPSAVVVYLLHARGEAQHRQTECQRPGPTRRLLFLGPRQDEAAKYLSVNFTRRPVPRGSFRGLLARRTTH